MIKVLMQPDGTGDQESSIHTVAREWAARLPAHGIEITSDKDNYDILAVHAGMIQVRPKRDIPIISHLHGLYWTGDYPDMERWYSKANRNVIGSILAADTVTVPSEWVAKVIERDFRFSPKVLPHAIDWKSWQHNYLPESYVVGYAKNREGVDVCNPALSVSLAREMPSVQFYMTFAGKSFPSNVIKTGYIPHHQMMTLVQRAQVYINPVKETFGLGILEAMASGVPVLCENRGSGPDIVQHGVGGYCYEPGNLDDMKAGLTYCLENRAILSENAREIARCYDWDSVAQQLSFIYKEPLSNAPREKSVGVVIPVYNKSAAQLERAISSALNQTRKPKVVVVVNDGSRDDLREGYYELVNKMWGDGEQVIIRHQENKGVAHARNYGASISDTDYICCLDSDDAIEPEFLEVCCNALDEDRFLGLAYTGLMTVMPDGKLVLSQWPGAYNYDEFAKRKNQVPTCCVFRKEGWERVGGYRQRYAPDGAGAEDAEFFLRLGAYGYPGKKVDERGLFLYSINQGNVSGNSNYREPNWTAWHPWTRDGQHPIGSAASPADSFAHPVRQYDEPAVSVVIPVGPGHEEYLVDALDSLEAQEFRNWEAIVVLDNAFGPDFESIKNSFPHVRFMSTLVEFGSCPVGAGAARNYGVRYATAPLILFLDADDWLDPRALGLMVKAWNTTQQAVYSDYIGHSYVDDLNRLAPNLRKSVLFYDEKTQKAVIRHHAKDYDCALAVTQPPASGEPYLWCNVTTLLPKEWHDEIGGFDETMRSWEDVDYFYRLAQSGKCFHRVEEPLLIYRFHTGTRRSAGLQNWEHLVSYMREKYETMEKKMCGCRKNSNGLPVPQNMLNNKRTTDMNDGDFRLVDYLHNNKGQHGVTGAATRRKYGYRAGGDRFLVHKDDIEAQPNLFAEVKESAQVAKVVVKVAPKETAPPEPIAKKQDIAEQIEAVRTSQVEDAIPLDYSVIGINPRTSSALEKAGIRRKADACNAGYDGLVAISGVGKGSAKKLLEHLGCE